MMKVLLKTVAGGTGKEEPSHYKVLGAKRAISIPLEESKLENKASTKPTRGN